MSIIPKNEHVNRIRKIQHIIAQNGADACVITSSVNLYYLVGHVFDGYLYILPEGKPLVFVKRPNFVDLDEVIYIHKPELIAEHLKSYNLSFPKKVMIESEVVSLSVAIRLIAALGNPEVLTVSIIMRRIRSVKSEFELGVMRECAKIHASVYEQIPNIFKKGMTDIEFQIELEYLMRVNGSMGMFKTYGPNMDIFMGSVLAGDNAQNASPFDFALGGKGVSPMLPLGANGTILTPGTTLMVDMAGNYRPIMDDMTRSFAIEYVPDIACKAHEVSIEIHEAIIDSTKSGTMCSDLYHLAYSIAKENGLSDYFMGTTQQAKFIGHGVGLEINEPPVLSPRSKEMLESGMTIAVEPKFVLPGIGAVGVENTYVVHDVGVEKITICDESLIVL